MTALDRLSIEPSRRCSKGCAFCYNGSGPLGADGFSEDEVVALATDCAAHGVRFLSLGGGEPLEWPGLFGALGRLRGVLARSFTTNGLPLEADPSLLDVVAAHGPDKVHTSLHAPENPDELARVIRTTLALRARGVDAGVNVLVRRSRRDAARRAVTALVGAGIGPDRTVLLPARGIGDAPSPKDVAWVAGVGAFQSMSCLAACGRSPRFASIGADRTVAFCSYTISRRPLAGLTHADLVAALPEDLSPCEGGLVRDLLPRAGR